MAPPGTVCLGCPARHGSYPEPGWDLSRLRGTRKPGWRIRFTHHRFQRSKSLLRHLNQYVKEKGGATSGCGLVSVPCGTGFIVNSIISAKYPQPTAATCIPGAKVSRLFCFSQFLQFLQIRENFQFVKDPFLPLFYSFPSGSSPLAPGGRFTTFRKSFSNLSSRTLVTFGMLSFMSSIRSRRALA